MNQERREALKQWSIGWRDPLYTLALVLGCVCLLAITVVVIVAAIYAVPAIKQWQHANAATTQVYEAGLIEAIDNVKNGTAEVAPTLKGLQRIENEATGYVADLRRDTKIITSALNARMQTLDTLLVSVRGVSDEARIQVKQNGDATAETVKSLNVAVNDIRTSVTRLLDDGSLMIETANPKLQNLLDNLNTVVIDADGTIKAYQPVGVNLAGITSDFNAMTTDSKNKLHEILYPAPVKGFWPNVRRYASYLYRPVFDGVRLYYTLQSLPVRLTEPIPLRKP